MTLSTHAPISQSSRRALVSPIETTGRRGAGPYPAKSDYQWMTSGPACCITALLSALITAHFVFPRSSEQIAAISKRSVREVVTIKTASAVVKPAQPSKLLNQYLTKQTMDIKSQMRFVASLIHQHKRPIEDAERLAYSIVSESFRAGYDPLFVAAVIKAESTFKHSAISNRGARGLMQILPTTARYVSEQEQIKWAGNKQLHDPENNIKLGIAYLKYLEKKFHGNRERVLIAYNWGPGNLEVAMKRGGRVPGQSVQYARQILSNHRRWRAACDLPNTGTVTAQGGTFSRPRFL